MTRLIPAAALGVVIAAGAMAQGAKQPAQDALPNWREQPRYQTLTLAAGFEPDPREVRVEAGGEREASAIRPECAGWIDFSRPDVDLNYTAGQYPLVIGAVSAVDTTIVINDADGNWHCNDDLDGLNPGVVFRTPKSGNYNIWVGTFERGQPQPATVRVSEILPQALQNRR